VTTGVRPIRENDHLGNIYPVSGKETIRETSHREKDIFPGKTSRESNHPGNDCIPTKRFMLFNNIGYVCLVGFPLINGLYCAFLLCFHVDTSALLSN